MRTNSTSSSIHIQDYHNAPSHGHLECTWEVAALPAAPPARIERNTAENVLLTPGEVHVQQEKTALQNCETFGRALTIRVLQVTTFRL